MRNTWNKTPFNSRFRCEHKIASSEQRRTQHREKPTKHRRVSLHTWFLNDVLLNPRKALGRWHPSRKGGPGWRQPREGRPRHRLGGRSWSACYSVSVRSQHPVRSGELSATLTGVLTPCYLTSFTHRDKAIILATDHNDFG